MGVSYARLEKNAVEAPQLIFREGAILRMILEGIPVSL